MFAPVQRFVVLENSLWSRISFLWINRKKFHIKGDVIKRSQVLGSDYLRFPKLNKGLAFTLEERQALGIHGLLPARVKTQEEQIELCKIRLARYKDDLNKFLYLVELHDRNEKLFFRLLTENLHELMPIVYTPTVAIACLQYGIVYRKPRGLFLTINDRGHCYDVINNWPEDHVRAVCVTDGQRILGLGDIGANGIGIAVGKMGLYTALAGLKPHVCLPVLLDVGTNNQSLLEDPLYVGLRQNRVSGEEYDAFVDEFIQAVMKRYGQKTVIQFEDFANHNAFKFLNKYRDKYCVFNDDIQGTAGVAVAGLLCAKRILKKNLKDLKYLFLGAGAAAVGISDLIIKAMQEREGVSSVDECRSKIWMFDIHGLLTKNRPEGFVPHFEKYQSVYAKDHAPCKNFLEVVNEIKPSVIIGVSTVGGLFTPEVLRSMAAINERPIVFSLSNPNSKSECSAEAAFQHTDGRVIFASGSPFPEVNYNGRIYKNNQGNNAYLYPAIALGSIISGIHHISEDVLLLSAEVLVNMVSDEEIKNERLYPPFSEVRECSLRIATKMLEYACEKGISKVYPVPSDMREYVKSQLYNFNYESILPTFWSWPNPPHMNVRPLQTATNFGIQTKSW